MTERITYYPNGNIFIKEYRNQLNERIESPDSYCNFTDGMDYIPDDYEASVIVYNINGQIIQTLMYDDVHYMDVYQNDKSLHNEYGPAVILYYEQYLRIAYYQYDELHNDYGFAHLVWDDGIIIYLETTRTFNHNFYKIGYDNNGIAVYIYMNTDYIKGGMLSSLKKQANRDKYYYYYRGDYYDEYFEGYIDIV